MYEIKSIKPNTYIDDMGSLVNGYRLAVHTDTGLDFFVDIPPTGLDKQAVHQKIRETADQLESILTLNESQGMVS